MIIDEVFGSGTDARALAAAQLGQVARRMADLIVEVITGALSPLAQSLMQTGLLPADITPEVITLSGGVGECYRNQPADPFCFSDIGPLLATALHEHPRLREMNVQFPAQTVRATVIGAGPIRSRFPAVLSGWKTSNCRCATCRWRSRRMTPIW